MHKWLIPVTALAVIAMPSISIQAKADPLGGAVVGAGAGAIIGGAATGNAGGAAAGAVIGGVTGATVGSAVARPRGERVYRSERVRVCYEDDWGRERCRMERRY